MSSEMKRCPVCGKSQVAPTTVTNYEYRTPMGIVTIERAVRFDECGNCGEVFVPGKLIDEWNHVILGQLAAKQSLLSPEELQFVFSVLPYSQSEIAQAAGKERSTLTRYKSGENRVDPLFDDVLKQIMNDCLDGTERTLDRLKSRFVSTGEDTKTLKVH